MKTHGMSKTSIHNIWWAMLCRCYNRKDKLFPYYGKRGIRVAKRWLEFENFYADMGDRPAGCSLERKDNNGHYTKRNCKWATKAEQSRNRRSNVWLTYKGVTLCASDWAKKLGIKRCTITMRIKRGWPTKDILATPAVVGQKR